MTDLRQDSMTGEQWVFEERSADPTSTEEGERWLRTDLNSGDKIGTLRVDVGSSIRDVPVFSTGTAVDTVSEAMRIQVNGMTGYVPIAPVSDAAFSELRIQHNSEVYGYHDRVEPGVAIPDSGVARWTFDNADTESGTALDVWNNNDGTINGATTGVSGANQTYTTEEAYSFDGSDDFVNHGDVGDPTDTFSVAFWMFPDSILSGTSYPFEYAESTGNFPNFYYRIEQSSDISGGNIKAGTKDSGGTLYQVTGTVTEGAWNHVVLARRGTTLEFYVDATSQGTASSGTGTGYTSGSVFLTGRRGNGNFWAGDIDDVRAYSKGLSDTEVSNLYNNGSI